MADRNPDSLPTPGDPNGPCPWCGRVAAFSVVAQGEYLTRSWTSIWGQHGGTWSPTESVGVLECNGCQKRSVVITNEFGNGVHWYPAPGSGALDPAVEVRVASAYDEGMRCLGIGANRAAAVMFRSALSLFVKDKGDEEAKGARHLKVALRFMKDSGRLHPSLWEWADHLNQLGNEGAHPEDYDDVTAEEASDIGRFVLNLIHLEYEMPARLLRARGLPVPGEPAPEAAAGDIVEELKGDESAPVLRI